jgi:general stress protein YciG
MSKHKFTKAQQSQGGKKSGSALATNRARMAEIGRLGGLSKARKRREHASQQTRLESRTIERSSEDMPDGSVDAASPSGRGFGDDQDGPFTGQD